MESAMESEGDSRYTTGNTPASDVPIDCDVSIRCQTEEVAATDEIIYQSFLSSDDSDFLAAESSTMSVMSSVRRFERENGRTYHSYRAGRYHFPNDPSEAERLDFQYAVHQQALNETLHFAPLSNPKTVLDIGTGTGAWAIQMGDAYPDALVEGTDLSPIQPNNVPENVQFLVDDAEQDDWVIPENHYDYIHTRILMGCFRDFRRIIQQGFKHTKPGGLMESHDVMHPPFCDDGSMPDDWPFKEWSEYIEGASEQIGRPLRIAHKLRRWYIAAGFVDVREKVIKLPINTWPRDKKLKVLGKWWAENLLMGLQAFSLALFSRVLGWSKPEIEVYLVNVRKAITNNRVHAYHRFYVVWGRKPENPPVSTDTTTPIDSTIPTMPTASTPAPAFTEDHTSSAQSPILASSQPFFSPEPQIEESSQPNLTPERKEEGHNHPELPIQESSQPNWTLECRDRLPIRPPEPQINESAHPDVVLQSIEGIYDPPAPEPQISESAHPEVVLQSIEAIHDPPAPESQMNESVHPEVVLQSIEAIDPPAPEPPIGESHVTKFNS